MSRCVLIVKETEFALCMKGHEKTGNDEFEVVPYLCLLKTVFENLVNGMEWNFCT